MSMIESMDFFVGYNERIVDIPTAREARVVLDPMSWFYVEQIPRIHPIDR